MLDSQTLSPETKQRAVTFMMNFENRVPCIYCRRSLTGFLRTDKTNPARIGRSVGAGNWSQWIYRVHESVNKKLFWQQVQKDVRMIWSWYGYQPACEDVKYVRPDTAEWWYHTFTFAYYMMCDYPLATATDSESSVRRDQIKRFFHDLADLLERIQHATGTALRDVLNSVSIPREFDTLLRSRIHYVRDIQSRMRVVRGMCVSNADDIASICSYAIVGCTQHDPLKVGC